ncbi:MAG: hypothetical protein ABEJ28_03865 [Salinigranum sp.]
MSIWLDREARSLVEAYHDRGWIGASTADAARASIDANDSDRALRLVLEAAVIP